MQSCVVQVCGNQAQLFISDGISGHKESARQHETETLFKVVFLELGQLDVHAKHMGGSLAVLCSIRAGSIWRDHHMFNLRAQGTCAEQSFTGVEILEKGSDLQFRKSTGPGSYLQPCRPGASHPQNSASRLSILEPRSKAKVSSPS